MIQIDKLKKIACCSDSYKETKIFSTIFTNVTGIYFTLVQIRQVSIQSKNETQKRLLLGLSTIIKLVTDRFFCKLIDYILLF
jgi:hypothetical protein